MGLKEKISDDMKAAMKSGDKLKLETIRSIRALILEFEKSGANKELTHDVELQMLTTAVKKRKESIEQFKNAARNDLAEKEENELHILLDYLPKQLNEQEIEEVVRNIASTIGAVSKADFSKLMPAAIKELKGKADGKVVKSLVEKVLGS